MTQSDEAAARTTKAGAHRTGQAKASFSRRREQAEATRATVAEPGPPWRVRAELSIVQHELATVVQGDERLIVVSLLPRTRATALEHTCGARFREGGGEWDEALQWCARQAGPHCRPVVLLSAEVIRKCFARLAEELAARRAAITLVVCNDAPSSENGAPRRHPSAVPLLRLIDDLAIMVPTDRHELRAMLPLCVGHRGPAALVAREGLARERRSAGAPFGLGEAELLAPGGDVALLAVGPNVCAARSVARRLRRRGVKTTVVNARFVYPLDSELVIDCARRCRRLVIVEDEARRGGFASAVLELLAEHSAAPPVRVLHLTCDPTGDAERDGETVEKIADQIDEWVRGPRYDESPDNELLLSVASEPGGTAGHVPTLHVAPEVSALDETCVERRVLSPTAGRWINAYSRIGQRTTYLWKWCLHGLELTTLPCVAPQWRVHVCDTKLLAVMLGVLLDDVADGSGNTEFLEALVDLVSGTGGADFSRFSAKQQAYAAVTASLHEEFHERIGNYPYYEVYSELLRFDNLQVWNTMRYADLLNRHLSLLNLVEHDLYLTHNMQMMSFATLDLMCSPGFECTELGRVREAVWHAQCMARIGNLVSTWQREISEKDFTSAVFARAVLCGELKPEQLASDDRHRIEAAIRNGGHEEYFLRRWQQQREHLRGMRPHIRSFDLGQLVRGLDRLIDMELSSRGRK